MSVKKTVEKHQAVALKAMVSVVHVSIDNYSAFFLLYGGFMGNLTSKKHS